MHGAGRAATPVQAREQDRGAERRELHREGRSVRHAPRGPTLGTAQEPRAAEPLDQRAERLGRAERRHLAPGRERARERSIQPAVHENELDTS